MWHHEDLQARIGPGADRPYGSQTTLRRRPRSLHGFTLIELLVVVAIIVALLAILLPSMSKAVAIAQDAKCRSQQRSVAHAFLMFAADHHMNLPGVFYYDATKPSWQQSWIGNEVWPWWGYPTEGTLTPYVGGASNVADKGLYRCPGLQAGKIGSSVGSNGSFDYASMIAFSGAKLTNLPSTAQVKDPGTGDSVTVGAPIVLEEDPAQSINRNLEPGHANADRLGSWHPNNGGNIASIDGSVTSFSSSVAGFGPSPFPDWTAVAPSGNVVYVDHTGTGYGEWNRR